ncbi:MAG: CHAT domain-containing protein [Vulcanimicrobiota bacterium]
MLPVLAQTGTELVVQAQSAEQGGHLVEAGELWNQAVVEFAREGNPAAQALSLFYRAVLEFEVEEHEQALLSLKEAEGIFRELKRDDGLALVLLQQGVILVSSHRLPEAEVIFRDGLEVARRHGNQERIGELLQRLAESLDAQHRWDAAYDAYRQLMEHQVINEPEAVAETLVALGAVKQVQTQHREALVHYRDALQKFLEKESYPRAAEIMDRISRLLLSRHDWAGAEESLYRAIEFHTAHDDPRRLATARANLAYALENQDRFQEAMEQYRESIGLLAPLGEQELLNQTRRQLVKSLNLSGDRESALQELELLFQNDPVEAGKLCLELGFREKAESYFQDALESVFDEQGRAELFNQLGMLVGGRSELSKAREFYIQSLELARKVEDQKLVASVLNNLGENYHSSGSYSVAASHYLEALEHFQESNDRSGQAYALSNLGTLRFAQGDYSEAMDYLKKAHALTLDPEAFGGPHSLVGTTLNAMGLVNQFLGRSDEAERLYLEAVAARRAVRDMRGELVTWNNLAAMFMENRAPRAAERHFRAALELSERLNDPSQQAHLHNNLGLALVELGRKDQAREHYLSALNLYREYGMQDGEAITLDNLGHLEKEPREALEYHRQAITILEKLGNRRALATAYLHLGLVQERLDDQRGAIKSLTRSVDLLDELALGLSPDDKSTFLGKNIEAYQQLVRLLVEQKENEEAFRVNERARARALLDLLGGRAVSVRNAPPELAQREESLRANIGRLLNEPISETNNDRLALLKKDYGLLQDEIARFDPGSAGLRSLEVPGTRELRKALGGKRALLEYVLMDDQSYLFLVTQDQFQVLPLELGEAELYDLIVELRRDLISGGEEASARSLGRLIEPALPLLGEIEELVIVPHQSLHYLPFSTILIGEQPLIEQYHLTQAPSASAWLLGQRQERHTGPFTAVALGGASPETPQTDELDRQGLFASLPGTLEEVGALTAIFPNSRMLTEEQFTSVTLQEASARSGVLHVATHGVLDQEFPLFSGLVTSDGLVTVADILRWEKTPDLVVLSACETALGKWGKGDDMVGLSRAFQAGGTRCLVVTLWPVSDESTTQWMTSFYEALKKKQTVAEASAAATRALREKFPSPYHWAPFVVVGDGRVRVRI